MMAKSPLVLVPTSAEFPSGKKLNPPPWMSFRLRAKRLEHILLKIQNKIVINCYLKLYTKFCKKRSSIFTKFNHSSLKLQNIFILSSVSLKPDSLNKVSRNNGLNCLNSIYFRFVYRPNYSHFFLYPPQ